MSESMKNEDWVFDITKNSYLVVLRNIRGSNILRSFTVESSNREDAVRIALASGGLLADNWAIEHITILTLNKGN